MRMRESRWLLLCLLATFWVPSVAQETAKLKAPEIPKEMETAERDLLIKAETFLSKGEFDQAAKLLQPLLIPSTIRVYVNWVPVPRAARAEYTQAVQNALNAWNQALAGALKFELTEREEEADLLLLFEWDVAGLQMRQFRMVCVDTKTDLPKMLDQGGGEQADSPSRRSGVIRVALLIPYTEKAHSAASITHLVGRGLGHYLGLAESKQDTDIMGPDWHSEKVALQPSESEVQKVRYLAEVRTKLLEYAQQRVALYLPRPALAIEKTEFNAGDVMWGEKAHYTIILKNVGDAPLEIEARPTCGCTVARYDRVIEPGKEGKIEAEMNTAGYRGQMAKAIEVTTNDPEQPQLSIKLLATITPVVQILPAENPTLVLKEGAPTVSEYEVVIHEEEPASSTSVSCSAPYATAEIQPIASTGGNKRYKLTLTVKPDAPVGRTGFQVIIYTTSTKQPQATLNVSCEKGIIVTPSVISLGVITPNTPLPIENVLTLAKRSGTFHIKKVETDDPANLQIRQEILQDGYQYRLVVSYKGGWSVGAVRRRLTIETDDPNQPRLEVMILANVVGALNP
ncbi:MAG: DUF1573 domain-containing protein [candidate division WOR-3 bacterium]